MLTQRQFRTLLLAAQRNCNSNWERKFINDIKNFDPEWLTEKQIDKLITIATRDRDYDLDREYKMYEEEARTYPRSYPPDAEFSEEEASYERGDEFCDYDWTPF